MEDGMKNGMKNGMERDFEGKTAIVTGGGSGIGKAAAIALAARGANVVVNDLGANACRGVADEITKAGGTAVAVPGNAADPEAVRALVDSAVSRFGALHVAFNNAGIGGPLGPLAEIEIDAYRQLMEVNLHSVFYAMRFEIPAMIAAGGGAILNMSSILGLVGDASAGPYVAAKHGVAGLTKAAALSYAGSGVRVNSIHPGYIDTPLLANLPKDVYDGLVSLHPMGRLGTSEEVTELALFLLSDRAGFITGSQHLVDGGYTAR